MPKKHNGSSKSKSKRQSPMQQWASKYRPLVDQSGKQWIFTGENRYKRRKNDYDFKVFDRGEGYDANKRKNKAKAKAKRRASRRNTRTLHQAQRRSS